GSVEDPMIRSMHGVGARSVGRSESVLRVPAAGEGEADRRGLGPADAAIGPAASEEPLVRRVQDRVLVSLILVARHPTMVWVEPDLPEARVPRKDGGVATAPEERVERVAHAPGPVLVVTDAQVQPGPLEDLGVSLEVLRDRHVDPIPGRLGPAHEGPLVGEPTCPAAPVRQAEWAGPGAERS